MTTRDIGIVLHEELDRREKLITQLTEEANSIRSTLGILERSTPEATHRVTRVVGRRGRKPGAQARSRSTPPQPTRRATDGDKRCKRCERTAAEGAEFWKHPAFKDGFDNHCKQCRNELRLEKKAKPARTVQTSAKADPPPREETPKPNGDSRVPCHRCGEKFANAKDLGIHTTRVHFSTDSGGGRSTLAGAM